MTGEAVDKYERLVSMFRERSKEELVALAAVSTASLDAIRAALNLPVMVGAGGMIAEIERRGTATIKLPRHVSIHIEHDDHKSVYEKLSTWMDDRHRKVTARDFASIEAMQRAIDADSCWSVQWYPDTPIGFYIVYAPTLEEALALAVATQALKDAERPPTAEGA